MKAYGTDPKHSTQQDDTSSSRCCGINFRKLVIHPLGHFRFIWDFISILLITYVAIVTPVRISLFWRELGEEQLASSGFVIASLVIDCWFMADLVLNFFTGFYRDKEQIAVLEPKRIALMYLQSWFAIDLISSLPYVQIARASATSNSGRSLASIPTTLRVMRLFKLLKLLRVSRGLRYFKRHFDPYSLLSFSAQRIITLVVMWIFFAHVNACVQVLVPTVSGFPGSSWIVLAGLEDAGKFELYSYGLFRAFSHSISCAAVLLHLIEVLTFDLLAIEQSCETHALDSVKFMCFLLPVHAGLATGRLKSRKMLAKCGLCLSQCSLEPAYMHVFSVWWPPC